MYNLCLVGHTKNVNYLYVSHIQHNSEFQPFPKRQILDSSRLKEHNFKYDENGGKISRRTENTGKWRD